MHGSMQKQLQVERREVGSGGRELEIVQHMVIF